MVTGALAEETKKLVPLVTPLCEGICGIEVSCGRGCRCCLFGGFICVAVILSNNWEHLIIMGFVSNLI